MVQDKSVSLKLSSQRLEIEAGESVELEIQISNLGTEELTLGIEVDGLPDGWVAIPVPTVNVNPLQHVTEVITISTPRRPECLAKTYPFVVKACKLNDGSSISDQVNLVVRKFSALSVEVLPKKGVSHYLRPFTEFDTEICNLGNTEVRLKLNCRDNEDAGLYTFEQDTITLQPGENIVVNLGAEPAIKRMVGKNKLVQFAVTARSADDAFVATNAQAYVEFRPLFTPTSLITAGVVMLLLLVYMFFTPSPARINEFKYSADTITQGQAVTISWNVSHSRKITISPEPGPVDSAAGSVSLTPTATTTYVLSAESSAGQDSKEITVVVQPAPETPAPTIKFFRSDPTTTLEPNQTVLLTWEVANAERIYLNPPGTILDPNITSQELLPSKNTTYELTVVNKDGRKATKQLTVTVNDPNVVRVVSFKASATTVSANGSVVVSWNVRNASDVTLNDTAVDPMGSQEFPITDTTVFTLVARNEQGSVVEKKLKVSVETSQAAPTTQ